ncbi:MAG: TonB-dependent receptor [Acidobacteriota bacterium]|nr:TonB-dependent receptor [Acidobacteriota bacterium]MDQ3420503.1 TonB-dependent receptor [Acidobacteriota bacterium]
MMKTRTRVRIAIILGGMLIAAGQTIHAQDAGRVAGRVIDQTGGVLPGVTIDIVAGSREMITTTDAAGEYRFEAVPPGRAELTYRLLNFSVLRRNVVIGNGASVKADAVLALSLNADVIVTGATTFRNVADIENPAESLVGIAAAASQGAITAAQLEARPVMRAGEVLETVPGMIVSQHSGEGKANQYFLRGFNLDHGTDFATTVAGVPVNTPTGAHAHGWMDLNFLIPELVSGVQFKKGPYYADEGDFSAAGAANINYVNQLDQPLLLLSGGNDGWGRVLGAASPRLGGGYFLAALELNHNDGPWVRPDDFRKVNGVLRYSRGNNRNGFSITGLGYWADWRSTDQVPARAVSSGSISRFGLVDASDQGTADRHSVTAELQRSIGSSSIRATGFALRNRLNLFSNFTYFLDDPDNGDQFEQKEQRTAAGGRFTYRRLGQFFERHTESAVGLQVRRDWLHPVGLYKTALRRRLSTTREDEVGQTMVGSYAQSEIEWTRALRTTVGVRADVYQFSVVSDNPLNSGDGSDALVSPKVAAIFGPWAGTELYANAGMGFHSNDARGAVIAVDPLTGEPVDRVTPLVRAKGAELGVRTVRFRGVQSTVALWYLGIDSELLFVGDAGTSEAGRPSRRFGIEWATYARLNRWLTLDADLSISRARFRDFDPAGDNIPGALDRVISGGITAEPLQPLFGSLRVRHFGPRPLIEDASVTSESTTLWNGELGYRFSSKARLVLEVFNLLDADVADVDYFYVSRLPGEPAGGVEDIHTHPTLPRSARLGVRFTF